MVYFDDEYIGKSWRTFWERFKDHLKAYFPIDNFNKVGTEGQKLATTI